MKGRDVQQGGGGKVKPEIQSPRKSPVLDTQKSGTLSPNNVGNREIFLRQGIPAICGEKNQGQSERDSDLGEGIITYQVNMER